MSSSTRRSVVAFLLGVVVASALGYAQERQRQRMLTQPFAILAGPDIGFRVESLKGETPVGRLMVMRDNQWVEVEFTTGPRLITGR